LKWTKASDIYSYGVLIFEIMAQAALPFSDLSNEELARKFGDASFVLSTELFRGISARQDPVSQQMCAG
jgi:hypothetical protein